MAISKVIFVSWCPDEATIKGRMVYATAKTGFKQFLNINAKDFHLSSKGDVHILFT